MKIQARSSKPSVPGCVDSSTLSIKPESPFGATQLLVPVGSSFPALGTFALRAAAICNTASYGNLEFALWFQGRIAPHKKAWPQGRTSARRLFRRRKVDHVNFCSGRRAKGRTTALHDFLAQHPHVALLRDQALHFFDKEEYFSSSRAGLVTEPDYTFCLKISIRVGDGASPRSHGRLSLLSARPRAHCPIQRGHESDCVLRNPVERAFSQWNMRREKARSLSNFSMP